MRWSAALSYCLTAACTSLVGACNSTAPTDTGAPDAGTEPVFPQNVRSWQEGRACMSSHEHELRYVRVVTDEAAAVPYQALDAEYPYPVGATLVKLEYDDEDCTELLGYTAMQKLGTGGTQVGSDWRWQRVDADRNVLEDGLLPRCVSCHEHHCTWPICGYEACGFDLTCGQEL